MKLTIVMDLDNDAFVGDEINELNYREIRRTLAALPLDTKASGRIRDRNGNTIGEWCFEGGGQ